MFDIVMLRPAVIPSFVSSLKGAQKDSNQINFRKHFVTIYIKLVRRLCKYLFSSLSRYLSISITRLSLNFRINLFKPISTHATMTKNVRNAQNFFLSNCVNIVVKIAIDLVTSR